MVKKYRVKTRGVWAGIETAQKLNLLMRQQMDEFLLHALIVMIEDFPPTGTDLEKNPEQWQELVTASSIAIYTGIVTGQWFSPAMGLVLEISRRKTYLSLFGPLKILTSELEPILEASEELLPVGLMIQDGEKYVQYMQDCLYLSVMSDMTLHSTVGLQTELLLKTGHSYVTAPSYRRHKKLIHALQGTEDGTD